MNFAIEEYGFPTLDRIRIPEPVERHLVWLEWENQVHNLTRIPKEDWLSRHVLDSAAPLLAGWSLGGRFLDLGSGPGFPGIPLAAFAPDVEGVLLESRKKVADNVGGFLAGIGWTDRVVAVAERAENAGRMPNHRGRYDRIVTRAVASIAVLAELGLPLLQEGGELWCWKSDLEEVGTAARALEELRGEVIRALRYRLPGEERDRFVISVRKLNETPDKYPRRPGIPEKRPL